MKISHQKSIDQVHQLRSLDEGPSMRVHGPTDRFCRPIRFPLTGRQGPARMAAKPRLDPMPDGVPVVLGNKGQGSNKVPAPIEAAGAAPNIPPPIDRALPAGLLTTALP